MLKLLHPFNFSGQSLVWRISKCANICRNYLKKDNFQYTVTENWKITIFILQVSSVAQKPGRQHGVRPSLDSGLRRSSRNNLYPWGPDLWRALSGEPIDPNSFQNFVHLFEIMYHCQKLSSSHRKVLCAPGTSGPSFFWIANLRILLPKNMINNFDNVLKD